MSGCPTPLEPLSILKRSSGPELAVERQQAEPLQAASGPRARGGQRALQELELEQTSSALSARQEEERRPASATRARQEKHTSVHKTEKGNLNTSWNSTSSLGAGSTASQGSLAPKSSAPPIETHAPTSYGHSKALEKNTVSTTRSHPSVDPEASTPVPVPTTGSPPIVSQP